MHLTEEEIAAIVI